MYVPNSKNKMKDIMDFHLGDKPTIVGRLVYLDDTNIVSGL